MKEYQKGMVELGGKMVLLMSVIEETLSHGDRLLIFRYAYTANLKTLDIDVKNKRTKLSITQKGHV